MRSRSEEAGDALYNSTRLYSAPELSHSFSYYVPVLGM